MRLRDVSKTLHYDKDKKVVDKKIVLKKEEPSVENDWGG